MKNPLNIGITGGIGSGKSLICKIFEILEVPVYYADDRAKWLMNFSPVIKENLIHVFGPQSYKEGTLDHVFLGKQVFEQKEKLIILNDIVHPEVAKDFNEWVLQNGHKPYLLKEAAIIFESGAYEKLDFVINISVPAAIRIERVLKRDSYRSKEQVMQIINKQLTDEDREKRADYTIINDNTRLVIPQVLSLHQKFITMNPSYSKRN